MLYIKQNDHPFISKPQKKALESFDFIVDLEYSISGISKST